MKNLMEKLQPFIAGIFSIENLDDEFSLQIIDAETEEAYGTVQLNESGQLQDFETEDLW